MDGATVGAAPIVRMELLASLLAVGRAERAMRRAEDANMVQMLSCGVCCVGKIVQKVVH